MAKLKYRDLTEDQRKEITNGCGGKGMKIKIPQFIFHADCNHHDFRYWRGGGKKERFLADFAFYKMMLLDVFTTDTVWKIKLFKEVITINPYRSERLYYFGWASIYFIMVRLFGHKFFYYTDKPRTLEDLKAILADKENTSNNNI